MIKIKSIKYIFPLYQYYFGYQKENTNLFDEYFSIIEIIQLKNNSDIEGFNKEIYNTGITDLSINAENIFKNFSPTKRNEINRANKEGITFEIIDKTKENIKKYIIFYNDFARLKGLNKIKYNDILKIKNNIQITKASINGLTLVYHLYIIDNEAKKIRLMQSCSVFRKLEEKYNKNLVSFANNGLHYYDIVESQKIGLNEYDWGGIYTGKGETPDEMSKLKISDYKLGFNPVLEDHYNYIKYGKVINFIKKIFKK